jgi:hypothetical protein
VNTKENVMQEQTSEQDLNERLNLISNMIAEGRRSTESWGWTFLLWGVAYCVAILWASWGGSPSVWGNHYVSIGSARSGVAWPVTMVTAVILTMIIGLRKGRGGPGTSAVRAIVSIWISVGGAMLLLFPALAISGRLDEHSFVAIVSAMLGVANGASGMFLRWKLQIVCAFVWWAAAVAACFGSMAQVTTVFLTAIFFCQIVFGVYAMILESRRNRREIVNA